MTIKTITAKETYPLRHKVLRPDHTIKECVFQGDNDDSSVHLGAFVEDRLVGIVSFMKDPNNQFDGKQYRMRGMAILPEYQGNGIGKELVIYGEDLMRDKQLAILWFNARENAVAFYEKLNFKKQGDVFTIPTVGPHFLMFKELTE